MDELKLGLLVIEPNGKRALFDCINIIQDHVEIIVINDIKPKVDIIDVIIRNINESIEELKKLELIYTEILEYKHSSQSGWYQPLLIGKAKQYFKNHTTRARSKPVTLCRYKWKLKKQKKNK